MAQQAAAVCTQVHPPTAITQCAAAWLTRAPPAAPLDGSIAGVAASPPTAACHSDLVVLRSNQLEVYAVRPVGGTAHYAAAPATPGAGAAGDAGAAGGNEESASLELLISCQLFGVAESVAVLRGRAPGQRDALLLTFRDAKLSVLNWDAARNELAPSSLHYFEADASLKAGRTQFPYPPLAVTDPAGRCAAVLFFRQQLAVLPAVDSELLALGIAGTEEELLGFPGAEAAADAAVRTLNGPGAASGNGPSAGAVQGGTTGAAAGGAAAAGPAATGAAAVGNSYVDNLGKVGIKESRALPALHVRDAVFLHGFNEPVLVLLHEAEPTWAGSLRQKKDTCVLTALSLNLTRKHHPKIWGAAQLPSDAYRLSAAPCGGVLVLCQHLVLYYRQGMQSGAVLHPSVLPPAAPPPPLLFDVAAMADAGGPGPVAAQYAQQHAVDVHPETVPAAVQFCDTSMAAELKATADGASVCWLSSDHALLCLRSGQLLQLALLQQAAGGGARKVAVARAGAAPQPSCCCNLGDGGRSAAGGGQPPALLFFGSAAGDSLLVRALPAAAAGQEATPAAAGRKRPGEGVSSDPPASKRLRLESFEAAVDAAEPASPRRGAEQPGNGSAAQEGAAAAAAAAGAAGAAAEDGSDSEDEEALIYGTALLAPTADAPAAPQQQLERYQLKVLDSLSNIGPVRDFAVANVAPGGGGGGEGPPCLVACSGEGKGGSLTVLRRSVVPDVITEVPLPGLLGAWAVHYRPGSGGAGGAAEEAAQGYHAYLLLSFQDGTKVLATGDELREVTELVEFAVDTPTLAAGSVCGGRRIVQAFPQGVRLLDGEESVQDVWASELPGSSGGSGATNRSIVAAQVEDLYILLLLSDGSAALLEADATSCRLAAVEASVLQPELGQVTACCLFSDSCGWLQRHAALAEGSTGMYCGVCRAGGAFQLYSLPSWQLVFVCDSLGQGPAVLTSSAAGSRAAAAEGSEAASIVEVQLASFGPVAAGRYDPAAARASKAPACEAPLLLALTSDHQLLAYRAFAPGGASGDNSGKLRRGLAFRRLPLDVPPLLPPAASEQQAPGGQVQQAWRLQRLHRFEGLGEEVPHNGLFVAGQHPHWLVASRGGLVAHPHFLPPPAGSAPGAQVFACGAAGFTPFHNVNCPHGYIVATSGARSGIQISQLPARTRLDAPWPRQRVAVKGTPLRVAHYAEADLFAVLASRQVPFKAFLPEEEEPGEPQASYSYALAEATARARGTMQGHEVRLVWPAGGWQAVWSHQLLPGERALSIAAVRLTDQTTGATVPLLAVGAALPAGEDYPCGGRLLLFEVVRSGGDGLSSWAGRLIYTREFKGPVTAVAGLEGYLLLASGNRIETCTVASTTITSTADDGTVTAATSWKVQRSAFYDGPMLLTSLNVVKNFVLLGDVQHSVQFVRYRDEGRQLSLLSKDFNRSEIAASQFLINGSSLHLAAGDLGGTLRLLSYLPSHPESWKGQRLVAWGSFHLGDPATAMQRLRMHAAGPEDRTARQAVLLSTDAGALQLAAPLALPAAAQIVVPAALAALRALQRELALLLPQAAGLNPAAFRRRYAAIAPGGHGGRCFSQPLPLEQQGVLDGDLLRQYLLLTCAQQEGAAEAAGLERRQLLELLQGLWRAGGTLL